MQVPRALFPEIVQWVSVAGDPYEQHTPPPSRPAVLSEIVEPVSIAAGAPDE